MKSTHFLNIRERNRVTVSHSFNILILWLATYRDDMLKKWSVKMMMMIYMAVESHSVFVCMMWMYWKIVK